MSTTKKVIVGMSGGVDSSVSAYLLQKQGYQVEGLFMKNWEEDDTDEYCSAAQDRQDAQSVCDKLGIPLHSINFAAEYWDNVFEHFLQEYQNGRTPNPDILCNREIKFKAFLDYAMQIGADYIATGHYVRKQFNDETQQFNLCRGLDTNKDQSYFLYAISQNALAKSLFPVGGLEKPEVRDLAKEIGLVTHDKKDSTGICFIGERRFKTFLSQYLPAQPGDIVTPNGDVVGRHDGLMYYTLGQRKGLGIGGLAGASHAPWFVVEKDLKNNKLVVTQGHDSTLLHAAGLRCNQINWVSNPPDDQRFQCTAKVRYRQQDVPCQLTRLDQHNYQVTFTRPERAVTPGQSVVFYLNDICLGGGIIDEILKA